MLAGDLPTRRVEAWKYSDLRAALAGTPLPKAPAHAPKREGVIERLALAQGASARTQVRAGQSAVVVETIETEGLDARLRDIEIGPGARLLRVVLQRGSGVALSAAHVSVAEGGQFAQFVLSEGGKLARIETHVSVDGAGAQIALNGVYLCGAGRHADLTSVITHTHAGATTRQLIKGAARKGGRGVFQGRIAVERAAQKTDARQHHHGLLLEEGAEIDAKPELLIYADDVQCAHGNTAGALDAGALFYMRARGIPERQARAMLTEAFLLQAVPDDLPEDVRADVEARIRAWLGGAP